MLFFKEQGIPISGINVFDLFSNCINELEAEEKLKSKESYTTTKNHLIGYCKRDLTGKQLKNFENKNQFSLAGITIEFLKDFEKHLVKKGLSQSSIGIHILLECEDIGFSYL